MQTAQPGQVNLVVSIGGLGLQFWDGAQTAADGIVEGGNGTWSLAASNWSNANGTANATWDSGFAVFASAAGTVTLAETLSVGGMQFMTDGYRIEPAGSAQLLGDADFLVRVDPGVTATVDASIADGGVATTLIKADAGTLVLGGNNTYSGGTQINGGEVRVGANANLGAANAPLTLSDATLHTTGTFTAARPVTLQAGGGTFIADASTALTLSGAVDGTGALIKQGGGTLVLSGSNGYLGGTTVQGGVLSVSADANLGASSGALTLDGGTLRNTATFATTRAITLAQGGGTFDTQADLTSNGGISGPGALSKIGSGAMTLAGSNPYTGPTQILAGTLRAGGANALSPASAITVAPDATLDLDGRDQTVPSLINAGTVRIGGQANARLSVTRSYIGQGGTLAIAAVLGDDDSPSDRLVMDGGVASGLTGVQVTNLGGAGALTQANGILVVDDITGHTTMPGAFALTAPVFAGPYEYDLLRGSIDASNAQAWYLRSSLDCSGPTPPGVCPTPPPTPTPPTPPTPTPPIPHYRPEVSIYAALPGLGVQYVRTVLGTLHDRVGDQELLRGRDDLNDDATFNGGWVRLIGLHGNADGDDRGIYGNKGPEYDLDMQALQGGFDLYREEHGDGARDHAGVSLTQGRIKSDVTDVLRSARVGKNEVEGTSLGAYWTHYWRNGGYFDAVALGTWFDSEAISLRGVDFHFDDDGHGFGMSLETGVPFHGGALTIEPQAQVIYQDVGDYGGHDVGARVRFEDIDSLATRLGVRVARAWSLAPALDGAPRTVSGWVRLSYWHEFEAKPVTSFSSASGDVPITTDLTGGWGQLNVGVSAQLGRRTSIYANLNYENGLGGRYDAWDGSAGFRWNW